MNYPINSKHIDASVDFKAEALRLLETSKSYLQANPWCGTIKNAWLFTNLGRVLCIFLYEIENTQSPEDDFVWVMVGDFPPMYLDTINVINTRQVIGAYVNLMNEWILQVENDGPLEDCYPVIADRSPESLDILKKRMDLLHKMIEPQIANIPISEYRNAVI